MRRGPGQRPGWKRENQKISALNMLRRAPSMGSRPHALRGNKRLTKQRNLFKTTLATEKILHMIPST